MRVEHSFECPFSSFAAFDDQDGPNSLRNRRSSGDADTRKSLQGLRLLIVEDELLVAMHLEEIAEELGCEIAAIAPTGKAAVRLESELQPDVVLMDINLGSGIDGIETAEILRERCPVAIIFVTAYRDPSTLGRIREHLPSATILNKPVSSKELKSALEQEIS
jgi:CheY-like chemotaxis protein